MASPNIPESTLAEVERLLSAYNFRLAFQNWQGLRQSADEGHSVGVDLSELRKHIVEEGRKTRTEITALLEALTQADIEQVDLDQMQQVVNDLFNATWPDEEDDYKLYQGILEDRKTRKGYILEYNRINRLVEDLWEQARRLAQSQRDIAVSALLDYYTQARDLAVDAAAKNPNNTLLQTLQDKAIAEREKYASEEEIMTSGGQLGDWVRVLTHLDRLREDEYVMVYSDSGAPPRRFKRDEARAEVIKNARNYVKGKAGTYSDQAQEALRQLDPRAAAAALKQYEKFSGLVALVPDIFRKADSDLYGKLKQQTDEALTKLVQAEALAKSAKKQANDDPLSAWKIYQQAIHTYRGCFNSEVIKNSVEYIAEQTIQVMRTASEAIQSNLGTRAFESARQQAEKIVTGYPFVNDFPLKDLHPTLQALIQQATNPLAAGYGYIAEQLKSAQKGLEDQRVIGRELIRIRDLAEKKPGDAADALNRLIREYSKVLVEDDSLYIPVSSRVNIALGASEERQRLEQYLSDPDLNHVREAHQAAQEGAKNAHPKDKKGYADLATQLDLYGQFLEAESLVHSKGYEPAISKLAALKNQPGLYDNLKTRIDSRLTTLRKEAARAAGNTKRLSDAEQVILSQDVEEAVKRTWDILSEFEGFTDDEQKAKWLNLFGRSLGRLAIDKSFNHIQWSDLLTKADDIDPEFVNRWRGRLSPFVTAQKAREAQDNNQLEQAKNYWTSLQETVSADEQYYVRTQLNALTKWINKNRKSNLVRLLNDPAQKAQLDFLITELTDMSAEFKRRAAELQLAEDQMDYLTWAIELDLLNTQYNPNVTTRSEILTSVSQYAQRELASAIFEYSQQLNERTVSSTRDRQRLRDRLSYPRQMVELAKAAPQIGQAMLMVERNLRAETDLISFEEAARAWENAFNIPGLNLDESNDEEERAALDSWLALIKTWYEDRVQTVREDLRAAIRQAGDPDSELSQDNLPRYAKLLILDSDDKQGKSMMDRLATLQETLRATFVSKKIESLPFPMSEGDIREGSELFSNQINDLRDYQSYLLVITSITEQFPATLQKSARSNARNLASECRLYKSILDAVIQILMRFQQEAKDFETYLDGFNLTDQNWLIFEVQIGGRFKEMYAGMESASTDLADLFIGNKGYRELGVKTENLSQMHNIHLSVKILAARMENEIVLYRSITDVLKNIKDQAEIEDFAEAQKAIETAPFSGQRSVSSDLNNRFRRTRLYDTFPVKNALNGDVIRGWEEVVIWVRSQWIMLDRILNWSAPFYSGLDDLPMSGVVGWSYISDDEIAKQIVEPLDKSVYADEINYQYLIGLLTANDFREAVCPQIMALIVSGLFEEAQERLQAALEGNDGWLGNLLPLREARNRASVYPLADEANGTTFDLQAALECAGSLRGRERLQWIYDNRQKVYEEQVKEAERLRENIPEQKTRCDQLRWLFTNNLKPLGPFLEKSRAKGLFRRKQELSSQDKRELENAVQNALGAIKQLRAEFPQHPDIKLFERKTDLLEAWGLVPHVGRG